MTNPIQLLRDFRKWRKERYRSAIRQAAKEIASGEYSVETNAHIYSKGILYGIERYKEILKK